MIRLGWVCVLSSSLLAATACGSEEAKPTGGFGEDATGGTGGGSAGSGNAGKGGSSQGGSSQRGGAAGATGGASAAGAAGNASGGNGAGGAAGDGAGGEAAGGNATGGNAGNGVGGAAAGASGNGNAGNGGNGNGGNPPLDFGGNGGEAGSTGAFGSCAGVPDWGANVAESLSTDGDDWLAAITPDERTIAYFVAKDGAATLKIADRAAATDPWGAPVDVEGGPFARDRVALESNGLVMGVLAADRRSFVELRRAARPGTFAAGTAGVFHNLETGLPASATLADPVIGEGDRTMFLSIVDGASTSTVRLALRFDVNALWGSPAPSPEKSLEAVGTKRREPTGLSADGRTLFFWDEPTGKLRRAVRPPGAIATFDTFTDIGFQRAAAPVTTCKRLYYSLKTGSTVDLFHADAL